MAFFNLKGLPLAADGQVGLSGASFELENKLPGDVTCLYLETPADGTLPEFLASCFEALSLCLGNGETAPYYSHGFRRT